MTEQEIKNLLAQFAHAWSEKQPDEIAAFFCEDGEYRASVIRYPATTARGRSEIADLVRAMQSVDRGSIAVTTGLLIDGQVAAWRWRYDFLDGSVERGSDFFEFRDGLIALKDAYRKVVLPTDEVGNA